MHALGLIVKKKKKIKNRRNTLDNTQMLMQVLKLFSDYFKMLLAEEYSVTIH